MYRKAEVIKQLVDTTNDGLITTNKYGEILSCNNGIKKLLGVNTSHQIIGKKVTYFLTPIIHNQNNKQEYDFDYYINHYSQGSQPIHIIIEEDNNKPALLSINIITAEVMDEAEDVYVLQFSDLSHYHNTLTNQQQKDSELNTLTENIPGIVFRCGYNRRRDIEFISANIIKLSGWAVQDFYEGAVSYNDLMSTDDEHRIWQSIGTAVDSNQSYTVEYRLLHKNGHSVWVSENGRVVLDEDGVPEWIVGSISDNTDTKKRSVEFEGTVEALNRATAVIEFDLKGCVLNANEIFLDLMGYKRNEIVGHHHRIFCSDEQSKSDEYKQFWEKLRQGEVDSGEYLRLNKKGEQVWIQATYNPIFDADGNPYKVMKFATDLSQRQEMEKELRTAIERAEEAVAAKGDFLSNMSHEIRTPMNAIIGFTEVLLKTKLDETQKHHASTVLNASQSLLRLLNEILDMAKLEKGVVDLEVRNFNLHDLFAQIIASLKVQAEQKNLPLVLDIDKNVPEFIEGDSLRIQQVLLNLLTNAIKFTESGSVTLSVYFENNYLTFKVIDTGIGMPKDYLKSIFDPFTQSDISTTRKFGGTGLGTSICHKLTKLMDGTINVESEEGKGSVFTVTLPIVAATSTEVKAETITTNMPALNILVAEDTPESLQLLTIVLESHGHTITATTDGQELVDTYKDRTSTKKKPFDIIITDLQMPKLNGIEACNAIREYERDNKISPTPVIALSANVLEEHKSLAKEAGMNGFSNKPLQEQQLLNDIQRALKLKSQHDDLQQTSSQPRKDYVHEQKIQEKLNSSCLINWEQGLKLWKKQSVYTQAIDNFLQANKDLPVLLGKALSDKDYDTLAELAHKVRGASGNLSLQRIFLIAENIENYSYKKDTLYINQWLNELINVLNATQKELNNTLKNTSTKQDKKKKVNKKQVRAKLKQLQETLTASQLDDELLNKLQTMVGEKELSKLIQHTANFDFDKALSEIARLDKHFT